MRVVMGMLLLIASSAAPADTAKAAVSSPVLVQECRTLEEAKQYEKALSVCSQAIKTGDAEAYYRLGRVHEKANFDLELALKQYLVAANKNHAPSQYRVAAAYYRGLGGVKKDEAKAFEWFKKSAEGGYVRSQKQLAEAYRRGVDGVVPKDEKLARQWQERADRGGGKN